MLFIMYSQATKLYYFIAISIVSLKNIINVNYKYPNKKLSTVNLV